MKLVYENKKIELIECKSFFSRLKGFMFQKKIDYALVFNRCNSIHTFFMKSNIDVIMCDKNNIVLYYYSNMVPNKVILPKKRVSCVYELPVGYFKVKKNERLEIIK